MQLTLDFVHTRENNPVSQGHRDDLVDHFNEQCRLVWELLERGERLQVLDCAIRYGVRHLPRRIKDIKDAFTAAGLGDPIKTDYIGRYRVAEYYL